MNGKNIVVKIELHSCSIPAKKIQMTSNKILTRKEVKNVDKEKIEYFDVADVSSTHE